MDKAAGRKVLLLKSGKNQHNLLELVRSDDILPHIMILQCENYLVQDKTMAIDKEKWVSVNELADYLGFCKDTIYNMACRKRYAGIKSRKTLKVQDFSGRTMACRRRSLPQEINAQNKNPKMSSAMLSVHDFAAANADSGSQTQSYSVNQCGDDRTLLEYQNLCLE